MESKKIFPDRQQRALIRQQAIQEEWNTRYGDSADVHSPPAVTLDSTSGNGLGARPKIDARFLPSFADAKGIERSPSCPDFQDFGVMSPTLQQDSHSPDIGIPELTLQRDSVRFPPVPLDISTRKPKKRHALVTQELPTPEERIRSPSGNRIFPVTSTKFNPVAYDRKIEKLVVAQHQLKDIVLNESLEQSKEIEGLKASIQLLLDSLPNLTLKDRVPPDDDPNFDTKSNCSSHSNVSVKTQCSKASKSPSVKSCRPNKNSAPTHTLSSVKPPTPKLESIRLQPFVGALDEAGPVQFIRNLELSKLSYDIDDKTFIKSWLPPLLRNEALQWYVDNKTNLTSWEKCKKLFLKRFVSSQHSYDVINAVRAIKQEPNESFQCYFKKCYNELLKADDSIRTYDKIRAVIHGLSGSLYHKLMSLNFNTLEELADKGRSIENDLKIWKESKPDTKKSFKPFKYSQSSQSVKLKNDGDKYCDYHKTKSHSNSECFMQNAHSSKPKEESVNRFKSKPNQSRTYDIPVGQSYGRKAPKPAFNKSNFQAATESEWNPDATPFSPNEKGN